MLPSARVKGLGAGLALLLGSCGGGAVASGGAFSGDGHYLAFVSGPGDLKGEIFGTFRQVLLAGTGY
ncbi:MAG: hypothetical protein ACRD1E_02915 [Terriglobales bacterium]